MTTEMIEGWVLDYACKFQHHEVVAALHRRYGEQLSLLGVSDARLCAATIHRIIYCQELAEFDTALQLVEELHVVISNVCPLRVYFRLAYALKMKVLMDQLKSDNWSTQTLNLKLNEYFPRCGIVNIKTSQKDLTRLQTMVSNFRKFFLSLLTNGNQRKAYLRDEFDAEFGTDFMCTLQKHVDRFLEVLEGYLPVTVLEKMLDKGTEAICKNVPTISASLDILLECLINNTRLESRDLLDLLTLLHPISTQDRLKPKLHLTFGSDDSSNDSRLCDLSNSSHEGSHDKEESITVLSTSHDVKDTERSAGSPDIESSRPVSGSGESISIISKRRPGVPPQAVTRSLNPPATDNQNLSQVYVISSSSDSGSATQSNPVSQVNDTQVEVLQKSGTCMSSQLPKDINSDVDTSHLDNSTEQPSSGDNYGIIQSSHLEEREESDIDPKKMSEITYPSLREHQKETCVRLCVIKLYRDRPSDMELDGCEMEIYS